MSSSKSENKYFVDVDNTMERERLARQGRMLQEGLAGHLPEQPAAFHDILDIACGDGAWVLDVARAHPEARVVGVDLSQTAIAYAQERAQLQSVPNASFRVLDALKTFDLADESFDLVNARLVYGFVPLAAWPTFIQQCRRILRPGGILRLTEGEFGLSNGSATERLAEACTRAMKMIGNSFSPDGRHTGITPMLWLFLRDGGFQNIQKKAYVVEYLGDRDADGDMYHNLMAFYKLLEPAMLKTGLFSKEEFDQLYARFTVEMESKEFSQVWYYLTAWGEKS